MSSFLTRLLRFMSCVLIFFALVGVVMEAIINFPNLFRCFLVGLLVVTEIFILYMGIRMKTEIRRIDEREQL